LGDAIKACPAESATFYQTDEGLTESKRRSAVLPTVTPPPSIGTLETDGAPKEKTTPQCKPLAAVPPTPGSLSFCHGVMRPLPYFKRRRLRRLFLLTAKLLS
jgi:hypothetical protein